MKSLVEYSSSSDDEALSEQKKEKIEPNHAPTTRKRKLPVPDWLRNKSTKHESEETIDDPEHHQGRQRSIKHERGIWATFLYIPIPNTDSIEEIQQNIVEYSDKSLNLKLDIIQDLHISVTKLLILKHHWIQSFIDTISDKVKSFSSFKISFGEIEIYCNEERTRTFIGVKATEVENLLKLTSTLDDCLEEFNLPKYYETPSFHSSILWCLGDKSDVFREKLSDLQEMCDKVFAEYPLQVLVTEILCKCGNRSYKFPFR